MPGTNLTNLDKPLRPEGLTKAHLIKYYIDIAPVFLPHLAGRPPVMKRYPDGVAGEAFYQKQVSAHDPEGVKTFPVRHHGRRIFNGGGRTFCQPKAGNSARLPE